MTTPASWYRYAADALKRLRKPDHEHKWVPWYNVWFGADYIPGDKEFSNGRGCLICHRREP